MKPEKKYIWIPGQKPPDQDNELATRLNSVFFKDKLSTYDIEKELKEYRVPKERKMTLSTTGVPIMMLQYFLCFIFNPGSDFFYCPFLFLNQKHCVN